jgi:hypothetical protein
MILVKEEFVGGEKWRRAIKLGGSDTIAMWLAMKCYCSRFPTEGFVPDEDLSGLPGAPRRARKALEALVACGRLLPAGERGPGLVEAVEGGWRLHDYLDHSASPEELELGRAKARLKKQQWRDDKRRELRAVQRQAEALEGGDTGGHSGDTRGDNGGDTTGDTRGDTAGARPRGGAREPGPARGGAHPNPPQPSPNQSKKSPPLIKRDPDPRGRARGPAPLGDVLGCRPPEGLPPTVVASLEPCAEHRRFAADHGLDLEHYLAEVRSDPTTAGLTPAQAGARLAGRLMTAATDEGSITERAIGGAA